MSIKGSSYARFRRAVLAGHVEPVISAARELERIGLEDALKIVTLLATKRDARYDLAAARLAGRIIVERRLALHEAHLVLGLLEAMPQAPDVVAQLLRRYC